MYIADRSNNRIRKVTVSTGIITTIAGAGTASYSGDNGAATSATLSKPYGVAVDSSGIFCFIFLYLSANFKFFKATYILGILIIIVSARSMRPRALSPPLLVLGVLVTAVTEDRRHRLHYTLHVDWQ